MRPLQGSLLSFSQPWSRSRSTFHFHKKYKTKLEKQQKVPRHGPAHLQFLMLTGSPWQPDNSR